MSPAPPVTTIILGHSLSSHLPNVILWKANILLVKPKINLEICYLNSGKLMPVLSHRDSERLQN